MHRCFVIQPFDNDVYDRRHDDTIVPAIKNAGLEPYRVDRDPSVSIPIDEIEAGIRNSRVCIAEITTNNPNVWFELGYAIAARKDVVLICSEERTTHFPFDVQHRHVIRYRTGSRSDLGELEEKVTARLKAIIEKQSSITELKAASPIQETEGLDSHEIVALATVMQNQFTPTDAVSPYQVKEDMLKAGHTELAAALSLSTLLAKGLLETQVIQDDRGYDYSAYVVTDKGLKWLLNNKDKLVLRRPIRPKDYDDFSPPPLDEDEGDLPF